ncbi:MAG: hypothetical protein GAK28_01251 [Luteibacter sp.]|uniref:dipeptidase n=1 Tax=Luteibacter sp. TaxID=1886636 RepID=UPI001381F92A|nr:membrane dipeptidase [Luteibacter sp.]KAF1008270.1 MAG: hypothetical protein GAK28_01251 [Luteibacter sp.]
MQKPITRRSFLGLTCGITLAPLVPAWALASGRDDIVMPSAKKSLYDAAFVLDANSLGGMGDPENYAPDVAKSLRLIRESGVSVLKSSLGYDSYDFEATVKEIADAQALIETYPETFLQVKRPDDMLRAKREGKLGVIFSFEAVTMLEDKIERIDLFRNFDVLVMQLTYNRKSPFGYGCLEGDTGGVTALGAKAIARMNERGITLDLSHSNAQTTADGIALSKKPCVVTHAGCRAVFDHPRNKRDKEMKALAEKGGVMGIYMLPFLTPDNRQPMLADYMAHMTHALDVCGEDHVGIGTDLGFFPETDDDIKRHLAEEERRRKLGIGATGENRPLYIPDANSTRKLEIVANALQKKGYGARTVEKVLGLNFRRVFTETWTV